MSETDPPAPKGPPEPLPATERPVPTAPPVGPAPSPLGTTLNDNYRIERLIGEGGMGEVYEGRHLFTGNRVAIKMILRELSKDEGIVGLFRREARILFDLADDAIVRYLDSFHHKDSDRYCLVMQFIDGIPLADRLEAEGALPLDQVVTLLRRLALGLDKAHALGVVHRDLSPDNVMLREGKVDRAALIDFGIATAEDKTEATLLGQFAGKYRFVAPEQLGLYDGTVGPRTDIYGLGLLIAAAARGTALEMGRSFPDAVQARARVPELADVPARLIPLLARMLEPDPADRPASMAEVAAMLDDPARLAPAAPDRTVIATPPGGRISTPPGAPAPSAPPRTTGLGQRAALPGSDTTEGPFRLTVPPAEAAAPVPARAGRRAPLLAAVLLLLALAAGGWVMTQRPDLLASAPEPAPPEEEAPEEPATPPAPDLPPPDTSTREGFLAGFVAERACTYATRVTAGADVGRIAAFTGPDAALPGLSGAYGEAFGVAPDVVDRPVSAAQCPALDLARALQGRGGVAPVLTLDAPETAAGGTVLGRLGEMRGRGAWLVLVTAEGQVFDLSSRLEPQADGSFLFAFTLNAANVAEPQGQLLLAMATPEPLVAAATATDGAAAGALLPRVLPQAAEAGAVAQLARFVLVPG
ncbi:serine/threonine-protein kinase [Jannaschia marina]|uniref:serine/threonine-protein kinase n=1 Tax=Jannaschia marina TaxID=2741674 RepID=UPI0015CAD647|nr:serine/threonine-protein kinase [Jannaschia marina]